MDILLSVAQSIRFQYLSLIAVYLADFFVVAFFFVAVFFLTVLCFFGDFVGFCVDVNNNKKIKLKVNQYKNKKKKEKTN